MKITIIKLQSVVNEYVVKFLKYQSMNEMVGHIRQIEPVGRNQQNNNRLESVLDQMKGKEG